MNLRLIALLPDEAREEAGHEIVLAARTENNALGLNTLTSEVGAYPKKAGRRGRPGRPVPQGLGRPATLAHGPQGRWIFIG